MAFTAPPESGPSDGPDTDEPGTWRHRAESPAWRRLGEVSSRPIWRAVLHDEYARRPHDTDPSAAGGHGRPKVSEAAILPVHCISLWFRCLTVHRCALQFRGATPAAVGTGERSGGGSNALRSGGRPGSHRLVRHFGAGGPSVMGAARKERVSHRVAQHTAVSLSWLHVASAASGGGPAGNASWGGKARRAGGQ